MSGLAYIVITPQEDDYVALVIRPYLPLQQGAPPSQARGGPFTPIAADGALARRS
jgi:hypothetical protein